MEVKVINISGKETGAKVHLPDAIFAVEPNDHAIYLDIKQYQANQRQGTHKSKQRNEIAGSTKKLYKQKGTGGARAGSIKSPLFNGGGRVFGPQPRDYSFKLNKKLKSLARKSALTYKAIDNNIVVYDHPLIDIIIIPSKNKIFTVPKDNVISDAEGYEELNKHLLDLRQSHRLFWLKIIFRKYL